MQPARHDHPFPGYLSEAIGLAFTCSIERIRCGEIRSIGDLRLSLQRVGLLELVFRQVGLRCGHNRFEHR
jgi:hypothetical protein